jgi:hypothetical protein
MDHTNPPKEDKVGISSAEAPQGPDIGGPIEK